MTLGRFTPKDTFVRDRFGARTLYVQDAITLLKKLVHACPTDEDAKRDARSLCRALGTAIGAIATETIGACDSEGASH